MFKWLIINIHLYTLKRGNIINFERIMLNNRVYDATYGHVQEVYQNRFFFYFCIMIGIGA